eukprot:TRINITY_DN1262_c0_g8_i2.p1 TRINITY_DN1262_c0_g8~~TRINITY_DN1262_c0_g8_i2.p1  ORF type:complete len:259 (+),score=43.41 TRINITY_DN1262_c0_g8_i2:243-1019(+)
MLRAKLRARRNDSINAERRNRNVDRVNLVNCMITPQISTKCTAPQAKHFPRKRTTSNIHKLPAIRKSHATQNESLANNKENINPSACFNSSSSDYYGVSLNRNLDLQVRKRLNALPNGRNQSIDAKRTKLTLPDDSNYEKIVSFVKDIKDTMAAKSECSINRTMTPCNEMRKCAYRLPNQCERNERLNAIAVVNPLRSSACELPVHRTSTKLWINKRDEDNDREVEEILKRLTLLPVMKLTAGEEQVTLALQDPFYII